jgi:hypothetical protein
VEVVLGVQAGSVEVGAGGVQAGVELVVGGCHCGVELVVVCGLPCLKCPPAGCQDMFLHRLPTGITLTPPLPSLYHQVTEVTPSSSESKTWKRAMDMSRPPYGQVGHLERGERRAVSVGC